MAAKKRRSWRLVFVLLTAHMWHVRQSLVLKQSPISEVFSFIYLSKQLFSPTPCRVTRMPNPGYPNDMWSEQTTTVKLNCLCSSIRRVSCCWSKTLFILWPYVKEFQASAAKRMISGFFWDITLSLTSRVVGVSGQSHAPAALFPGKKARYPSYRMLDRFHGRSGRVREISLLPSSRYND